MRRENTSLRVTHKRFGEGEMLSFNPHLTMVIVFERKGQMEISTTKEHMAEVSIKGRQLMSLVDVKHPAWYPDYLSIKTNDTTYHI